MSRSPSDLIVIYDGSALIGRVVETADRTGFDAVDADGVVIETFANRTEAVKAAAAEHDRQAAQRHRRTARRKTCSA